MQGWFSLVVTIRVTSDPLTVTAITRAPEPGLTCEGHQPVMWRGRAQASDEDEQTRACVSSVASPVTTPGHHNNSTEPTTAVATTAHRIQIWRWDQISANFKIENQLQVPKRFWRACLFCVVLLFDFDVTLNCGGFYQSKLKLLYFVQLDRSIWSATDAMSTLVFFRIWSRYIWRMYFFLFLAPSGSQGMLMCVWPSCFRQASCSDH